MIYTKKDKKDFEAATVCHICGYNLRKKCEDNFIEDRVRDHCHLTGKFRGAAHNQCNLGYKIPNFIPVFFHNLSGYDSHIFIKKLKTDFGEEIKCIPKTEENYISFSKQVIVDTFVDKNDKKEKTS